MYGRREQAEAHTFVVDRLVAAVLRVDPDTPDRPLRRTTVGVFAGIGIVVLIVAIILIVTLFFGGGGDDWSKPGTVIVDEDSGNRYLLVDDRLRPVLNLASARLLVGGDPPVALVSGEDLADIPQGAPIGIPGAPDTLPPANPTAQPWFVCAGTRDGAALVSVTVGELPEVTETDVDEAVLVRVDDGLYLAWQGTRLRVVADWVPRALGLDPALALPVDPAWLNTLPAGPDLGVPPVTRGGPGPDVDGRPATLGQLVSVPDAVGDRTFVVAEEGLLPVSLTVAALLAADPNQRTPSTITLTPARLAGQKVLSAPAWQADLPARPPALWDIASGVPCVRWQDDRVALVSAPGMAGAGVLGDGITRDERVADLVQVLPGAGMIARTRPAPGVPGAGIYLVAEAGAKFPVADGEAAEALGFSTESAVLVPAVLLALLPTGPVLDLPE
jgi:type VII secretion protein EccB